ncbi:hypothetical protein CY34DRAFT_358608 [Suillus luteus UH-Slu-Lm8-n1]|uniref:Uncharacterized protein n=1 Tax=Suillus luteus UH-Slu-Lm8-n1 TaxID=930992 RepID=A0A0D0A9G9_9AGAM|nr:hypothetical protein CY34DRAFT_358608 [Suillus luteus UH-Slu-Lm8-n1]
MSCAGRIATDVEFTPGDGELSKPFHHIVNEGSKCLSLHSTAAMHIGRLRNLRISWNSFDGYTQHHFNMLSACVFLLECSQFIHAETLTWQRSHRSSPARSSCFSRSIVPPSRASM